eukprot:COSAG05_NODE_10494_length_562_cov_1.181425_2_plen_53_part_01
MLFWLWFLLHMAARGAVAPSAECVAAVDATFPGGAPAAGTAAAERLALLRSGG